MFNLNTAEQLASLNQANLEKTVRLSNIALAGVERLANLQMELARNLLAENTQTVKTLSEVKDVQGLVALQQQLSQPSVEKALSVARNVYEAASATQTELNQMIEENIIEFNKNLAGALDKAIKNAPAGSDVAFSALKTAVSAATTAYDAVTKTAKKVGADLADATVAAAETSAKAATTAARPATKKSASSAA